MAGLPLSSLRSRLVLLVLLAVLPALGLTLHTNLAQRQQAVAQVQGEALRLARIVAADQARLLEGARQLLTVLARVPAVRDGDPAGCSALLAELLAQYPWYANLGVASPEGDVVCSALPAGGAVSVADRLYFRRALETRDFAVGEYQVGRITGRAGVNFGYPVLDGAGQVRTVLFASLDLAWLNQLAAEAQLPPGSALTVLDRNGTILVRYPDPEPWVGQAMTETVAEAVRADPGEGTASGPGLDGVPRLFAFAPLGGARPRADAHVVVGVPVAVAFAEADRTLTRSLRWLALVGALALATAAVGGDVFILRRVRALSRATQRLSAGDLTVRTGLPHGRGELGQLAQAIDELAASLQAAHQRLVDGLLDLAHPEAGAIVLRPAASDVGALVRGVAGTLRPAIEAKGQRLTLELPAGPLVAWADPERVAQVLANLLSNAHRHTPPGGRIAVAARAADDHVRVEVRDSGPGLPADAQTRLLAGPPRAPAAAARAPEGAGRGLPISRALVELHGGRLTVASAPGAGATFSFTLPAAPAPGGQPGRGDAPATASSAAADATASRPERRARGRP